MAPSRTYHQLIVAMTIIILLASAGLCADRVAQEFDYASALSDQGFLDLAEIVYRDAIAAHPDHAGVEQAVLSLAQVKAQMRRLDEALADYQTFLKKYGYSKLKDQAEVGIGEVYLEQGEYEKAQKVFQKVLGESPDGASLAYVRAQYGNAWCMLKAKKYKEAAQAFKEFALIWQGYERAQEALLAEGECYLNLENYEEALKAFDKARERSKDDAIVIRALIGMGRAHQGAKAYDKALLSFDSAIRRDPDSPFAQLALASKADCLAAKGDEAEGKKILEEIMLKYPGTAAYQEALNKLAKLSEGGYAALASEAERYARALKEFRDGNCEAAITWYEGLIKKFPKGTYAPKAQQGIARCYHKMEQYKKAADAFMEVATKYADSPIAVECIREAVASYDKAGDAMGKQAALKKLAEAYPESGKADAIQFSAAATAYDEKDYKTAAESFLALVEKYPRSEHCEQALFQAGFCFYTLQQYDQGEKTFDRFLKSYSESDRRAEAAYLRGECLYHLKKIAEAMTMFRAALRYNPKPTIKARAHFWLGYCLQAEKKWDEALEEYNTSAASAGEDADLAPKARYCAALLYSQKGQYDKCAERLLDLVNDFPTYPVPAKIMSWASDYLMEKKQYDKAAKVADLLIARYGEDAAQAVFVEKAYTVSAKAKMQAEQWKPAIELLEALLQKFPDTRQIAVAKMDLAECYKQRKQYDKAKEALQELIPQATGELLMEAQAKLADVHKDEGQPGEEANVLKRAVLLAPAGLRNTNWLITFNHRLGKLYEQMGKKEDAVAAFKAAAEIPTKDAKMLKLQEEAQERLTVLSK
ncbi:MAG: tetratricopeptide repeat protein [Planctomycetota bacterium]